ncbi:ABC transporter ATP-binding protein [Candidatus Rhodobacter oscarellae]|uniref:ABC transporter ATP-binding protein n=1 Tax=Candidatus Rhodobacter oscarellae TaxID=1675527 RepID=A0A0J9E5R6_9RHOB|nr:sn-glycerol-3-phosphate ABC transporter ATP-binding protein UgpC [Candidatus Rhodobacter lobularis]KMW58026.1 ABC transporter ATP-binding protein [Candidatus Rhodobacter lobularis]
MATVSLKNVDKSFGNVHVIKGASVDIADQEFVALVGPSGCGKSTLLRTIAGLEEVTGGEIEIGGRVVNNVSPSDRQVAMVFQSYALYPHMTVRENMSFGLEVTGHPKAEIAPKVDRAAGILRLEELMDRKPKQLSGGQRQRVAIGRAIVRDPGVFLFDEPLSNLDAELRVQMRVELALLHQELSATMIYVTHDQIEAMTLADKIVVLHGGVIEQVGAPMELYDRPANDFVAGFIGSPKMNMFAADVAAQAGWLSNEASSAVKFGVRPEHMVRAGHGLAGQVFHVEHLGGQTLTHLKLASGHEFVLSEPGAGGDAAGDTVHLRPAEGCLHAFDANGLAVR